MNKENINWQEFAQSLLWNRIVYDKNGYSGWDIMLVDGPEGRGIHRGDIGHWSIQSYLDPLSYAGLTWKGLAVALGIFEDFLIPDGHDCKKCPEREKCQAFFKDDEDHERCNWWEEHQLKG